MFGLSAAQNNAESFLHIGDFHYYGRCGLGPHQYKAEAAHFYQRAADLRHTQAIFNLGVMHEAGDGVTQDFHLAKRYFDQAADFDPNARLPRNVALTLMQSHQTLLEYFGEERLTAMVPHLLVAWQHLDAFCHLVSKFIKQLQTGFARKLFGKRASRSRSQLETNHSYDYSKSSASSTSVLVLLRTLVASLAIKLWAVAQTAASSSTEALCSLFSRLTGKQVVAPAFLTTSSNDSDDADLFTFVALLLALFYVNSLRVARRQRRRQQREQQRGQQ